MWIRTIKEEAVYLNKLQEQIYYEIKEGGIANVHELAVLTQRSTRAIYRHLWEMRHYRVIRVVKFGRNASAWYGLVTPEERDDAPRLPPPTSTVRMRELRAWEKQIRVFDPNANTLVCAACSREGKRLEKAFLAQRETPLGLIAERSHDMLDNRTVVTFRFLRK